MPINQHKLKICAGLYAAASDDLERALRSVQRALEAAEKHGLNGLDLIAASQTIKYNERITKTSKQR